jgi:hypothetical protein
MKIDIKRIVSEHEELHLLLHESLTFRVIYKFLENEISEEDIVFLIKDLIKVCKILSNEIDSLKKD